MRYYNKNGEEIEVSQDILDKVANSYLTLRELGIFTKADMEEAPDVLFDEQGAWNWDEPKVNPQ
jgi:hypothetical protein